jgi:hypothetical protein
MSMGYFISMQKLSLVTIFFVLLLSVNSWAKPRTYEEIVKSKELRICYVAWMGKDTLKEYPNPYLEIAIAFAKSKNWKSKVQEVLWDEQFKNSNKKIIEGDTYTPYLFDTQVCDVFSNSVTPVEWRKKLMDINWMFLNNYMVLVRKNEMKSYKSIEDLKGKTVVVVPKTTFHEWLIGLQKIQKKSDKIKIIEVPTGGTLSYLQNKQADFIILGIHQAMYSKLHLSTEIAIAFPVGKATDSGWGFPKEKRYCWMRQLNFLKMNGIYQIPI